MFNGKTLMGSGMTEAVTFHEGWHQYCDSYFGFELQRWFDEGHGDYFGSLHARVGQEARRAETAATIEENVSAGLTAQRDAVSGVSLDEEFTNLIRYQRGFQAAAQLINVSNVMLDDLLGLVS